MRVDSGAEAGYEVLPLYDPMIAKLIVWDVDREASTRRMLRALDEFEIGGLKTLIPFHRALLATEQWRNGETCRDLVEDKDWLKQLAFPRAGTRLEDEEPAETVERKYAVEVSGRKLRREGDRRPASSRTAALAGGQAGAPPRAQVGRRRRRRARRSSSRRSRAPCSRSPSRRAPRSRRAR